MWTFLMRSLSRSESLNALMGDVVFITEHEHGFHDHSFFQWRVKNTIRGDELYVSIEMIADAYAGREGSPRNYMSFDLAKAKRLRNRLDECIQYIDEKKREGSAAV
jgi:hypothetical protein